MRRVPMSIAALLLVALAACTPAAEPTASADMGALCESFQAVTDVTIRGACRRGDLEGLPDGALVVIDCEGCEQDLLRDPLPAGLARAHLVVELHGALLDDDDVARRLRRTHLVEAVPTDDTPPPADLPFLSDAEQRLAVQENRSPQRWLLCRPRA